MGAGVGAGVGAGLAGGGGGGAEPRVAAPVPTSWTPGQHMDECAARVEATGWPSLQRKGGKGCISRIFRHNESPEFRKMRSCK